MGKGFFRCRSNYAIKLTFGFENVLRKRNFLASSKFTTPAFRNDLKMVETHSIFGLVK